MKPWPVTRAILVTLAMVIAVVDGCPLPPTNRAAYQTPAALAEAGRWSASLGKLGIHRSPESLAQTSADLTVSLARAQQWFLSPFRPIGKLTGVRQRWKLFPVADKIRYRMAIEMRVPDEADWVLLYRPHDDAHDFMAGALQYRRLRGAWNPGSSNIRQSYAAFCTWIAQQVFARYPAAVEVRVRMEKLRMLRYGRGYDATGEWAYEQRRTREQVKR